MSFTFLPIEEVPDLRCGALVDGASCLWRVWAPLAKRVTLVFPGVSGNTRQLPMSRGEYGHFEIRLGGHFDGERYAFSLDGGPLRPDPASHSQPDGVHEPSQVIDLNRFDWTDQAWRGASRGELSIYELHVGTFTNEGTFDAIIPRLPELKELGVSAIELLPVAQFPGRRNWGYDGVGLYAAQSTYGGPRGLQRLVDAAHAQGLAVILDVVYNHLGPEGNYLSEFGPYFSKRYRTPWGHAVNFDDYGSDPVRDFVLHNVRMWIRDFHLDGLRLDAIHAIYDNSPQHILTEIKRAAVESAGTCRQVQIIAESDLNDTRILLPEERGVNNLDSQWSDDFHHALHTLLTGERNGYYADYDGSPEQLAKALSDAFIHDGTYKQGRGRRHGAPIGDMTADRFVIFLQNHDQIGNRAVGDRLTVSLSGKKLKLAAALLLLSPFTPLLFMGEEYGEVRPFPFFCDFGDPHLQENVRRGRRREFAEFGWKEHQIPDPQDHLTYESAILSWDWHSEKRALLRRLHRTLLHARREWPELRQIERSTWSAHVSESLLVLSRGGCHGTGNQLVAYFNLSDRTQNLSDRPAQITPLILSSTEFEHLDGSVSPTSTTEVEAWGFRVFRQSGEGTAP